MHPRGFLDPGPGSLTGLLRRLVEFLFQTEWPKRFYSLPCLAAGGAPAAVGIQPRFSDGFAETARFNIGPSFQTYTGSITSSIFRNATRKRCALGARRVDRVLALPPARDGMTLRGTALEVLGSLGFTEPEDGFRAMERIPRTRLHCRTCTKFVYRRRMPNPRCRPQAYLRTALILGKCRNGLYDPERPVIWTEERLLQRLELYEIGNPFYL